MRASVIVPLWGGAATIADCLDAVLATRADGLAVDILCVDNASRDDSARIVASRFPQVRLISEPANLGFAGGVNAGIEAAEGDACVLLNQDCLVQPDCLAQLMRALAGGFGIAGCTILNQDGSVNHAGARLTHPLALGAHDRDVPEDGAPRAAEYVTGAVFALSRAAWDAVGAFDEGFHPAYYEETDYCFRARQRGILTGYAPAARATHLLTNREWQTQPLRHTAQQHRARYRFVGKHFTPDALVSFFAAEQAAVAQDRYFDQSAGRAIASRDILRGLGDILARRAQDLGPEPAALQRQRAHLLRQEFAALLGAALAKARAMATADDGGPDPVDQSAASTALPDPLRSVLTRLAKPPAPPATRAGRLRLALANALMPEVRAQQQALASLAQTLGAELGPWLAAMHDEQRAMLRRADQRLALLELIDAYDHA